MPVPLRHCNRLGASQSFPLALPVGARRVSKACSGRSCSAGAMPRRGRARCVHVPRLTEDGPLHRALVDVARVRGAEAEIVHREERALLESALSPEDYWDGAVRAKKRKELRRQANRLAEQGAVRFRRWQAGRGDRSMDRRLPRSRGARLEGPRRIGAREPRRHRSLVPCDPDRRGRGAAARHARA